MESKKHDDHGPNLKNKPEKTESFAEKDAENEPELKERNFDLNMLLEPDVKDVSVDDNGDDGPKKEAGKTGFLKDKTDQEKPFKKRSSYLNLEAREDYRRKVEEIESKKQDDHGPNSKKKPEKTESFAKKAAENEPELKERNFDLNFLQEPDVEDVSVDDNGDDGPKKEAGKTGFLKNKTDQGKPFKNRSSYVNLEAREDYRRKIEEMESKKHDDHGPISKKKPEKTDSFAKKAAENEPELKERNFDLNLLTDPNVEDVSVDDNGDDGPKKEAGKTGFLKDKTDQGKPFKNRSSYLNPSRRADEDQVVATDDDDQVDATGDDDQYPDSKKLKKGHSLEVTEVGKADGQTPKSDDEGDTDHIVDGGDEQCPEKQEKRDLKKVDEAKIAKKQSQEPRSSAKTYDEDDNYWLLSYEEAVALNKEEEKKEKMRKMLQEEEEKQKSFTWGDTKRRSGGRGRRNY